MVFNLDREFSCGTHNQATDRGEFFFVCFLEAADQNVEDRDSKAHRFSLACLGCNNHVEVRLQVHQRLTLHISRREELICN